MGNLSRSVAVLLACFTLSGYGQAKQSTIEQKSERSKCVNIVALAGNVNLNCSDLTLAQQKALAQIPAILKEALTSQDYLEEILRKLSEMSKPVPTTSITVENGIQISGGVVNQPTVINNGETPPVIKGLKLVPEDSPEAQLRFANMSKGHPTTSVEFYVETSWNDPMFVAICDRPCHGLDVNPVKPEGVRMGQDFRIGTLADKPNMAAFIIDFRPFKTFTYYVFTVICHRTRSTARRNI